MELDSTQPAGQSQGTGASASPQTTTFTIDLGEVEITPDEAKGIMNEIVRSAASRASVRQAAAAPSVRVIFGRFGSFGSFGRVAQQ
jgi:hypothetical protein